MLTYENITQICRICLRPLFELSEQQFSIIPPNKDNAQLANLLKTFLAIDLLQQPATFPQRICNLCYSALLHFQQLCLVAQQSTETLTHLSTINTANDTADKQQKLLITENEPWEDNCSDTISVKEEPLDLDLDLEFEQEGHDEQDGCMGNEEGEKEQEQQGDNVEDTLNDDSASSTHAVNNKKGKLLACQLCGKQVYKLPYLEAHIRSVHEGHSKPFLCRGCNKSYTRYEQLRSHMRNVHPNSPLANTSNDPSAQQDQPLEQQRLICELCNRQYSTKNALGEHLKRHAQFKQHVCEHCGVAKVTRTELLTHLQVHNPDWQKFKCEQCPQLFRHKSAITRHVRVVHEGQRRYKCTYCHRRFGTHASQLRHEKLHEGELPHQCKVCGMRFADLDRLTTHMCAHDSNLWPYTCVHCSKSCTTRQNLVIHEQRHASKKPHICNTCSRGFISELLLAQHKQIPCIERCSNVRTTEDTESGTT